MSERNGMGNTSDPADAFQLPEPDLSHYLSLRRAAEAAAVAFQTWQQALQTLQMSIWRSYGFGPAHVIDDRGIVRRNPDLEPAEERPREEKNPSRLPPLKSTVDPRATRVARERE